MDLIKNFDFAEFDHDKILENVTPILLPERNVTSDQVSCKVPGMEDVRMLFAICQDEKLYLLTKKALMREKVLLEEMTDRVKMMDYDWQIDKIIDCTSDAQLYKQAGNGVTVNVIEAIGRLLQKADSELNAQEVSEKGIY